jgi:oligoribonuclease NrnB/cAMP/cGMP phosphodiesterase (DHH superfamily)
MIYILYHGDCPDGFGAAYAAWKHFGNKATYLPVQHNQPVPELWKKSTIYLVDFCYPKDILLSIVERAKKVQVIDHHISAQKDLADLSVENYPQLSIHFDMQKSGAVLTWEHFHPDTPVPEFLYYIQDKDLWQFKLPLSKEFSASLRCYEMKFELWDSLVGKTQELCKEGIILMRYQTQLVNKMCNGMFWAELAGHKIPAVNSSVLQSEIGNQLCTLYPDAPFSMVYFETEGKKIHSLRSVGEFDVSLIAKQFGGGGHKNAAGFVIPLT